MNAVKHVGKELL